MNMEYRVILYHKQSTSARTRFVRFSENTIFAFGPMAKLAQAAEQGNDKTALHPAAIMQLISSLLGLPVQSLRAENEFKKSVEVPGGEIRILLVAIETVDPPFDEAEAIGARFIDLTQARGLPQVEMEMLRHAYEVVLG